MSGVLDVIEEYQCFLNRQDVMEVGTYKPIGSDAPCLKVKIAEGMSNACTLVLLDKKEIIRLRNQLNNILMEL